MKVFITAHEIYPVYAIDDEQSGEVIELTEEELARVRDADAENAAVQAILESKFKAARVAFRARG